MHQTTARKRITSFLLTLATAAVPVLLAVSCAAGPEDDEPRERIASVAESQETCGAGNFCTSDADCPVDECATLYACKTNCCVYEELQPPGKDCIDPSSDAQGICLWNPEMTVYACCTGCMDRNGFCQSGGEIDLCGSGGEECAACRDETCGTAFCSAAHSCEQEPQTGTMCPGGLCVGGVCCFGCVEGATCYIEDNAHCGSAGGSCEACGPCEECDGGACVPKPAGDPCDDGSECTTNDECNGGECVGEEKDCDDPNECTADSCDPAIGCVHDPVDGPCDSDGDACTEGDTCVAGVCQGTPIACDDGNFCTDDDCEGELGCVYASKPQGTECDDGNSCSPTSACEETAGWPDIPRQCVATAGLDCNDADPCTSDQCDDSGPVDVCQDPRDPINEGGGCSNTLCLTEQTCAAGECQGGMPLDCDDANPCTADDCDPATGCTHEPIDETCNDGNPCTLDDACANGACSGVEVDCASLDSCHQAGACDASTGTCSDPRKPNGATCGSSGRCENGSCVGETLAEGGAGGETGGPGSGGDDGPGAGGDTGTAATGASAADGGTFVRDPGGCACSVPGQRGKPRGLWTLVLSAAAGAGLWRRRRAAYKNSPGSLSTK